MTGSGPLVGIRSVVLTQYWAGTFCTELLAMMGAEVIQIESRRRPDGVRWAYEGPMPAALEAEPTAQHAWNCSPNYNGWNLNKLGITLDISMADGLAIYKQLVAQADIVADNFTPRVTANLGIDYESLRAIKPDLIYCSISGYGASGPYANASANGGTIDAASGMASLLGYADDDSEPLVAGAMYQDAVAGYHGFAALITALLHRDRTGEGQYIEVSMQEANHQLIGDAALEYALTGTVRRRLGNRHTTFAPHGIYPALGEEQWVAFAAETERQWHALCELADRPQWRTDPRFADNASRKENEDALDQEIAVWTAERSRDELATRLSAAGLPAAPVLDSYEVAEDAVFRERGHIVEVAHPEAGTWPQIGVPYQFSRTPAAITRPAPMLGEHSAEVFERLLGIDHEAYAELVRKGVTGTAPPD